MTLKVCKKCYGNIRNCGIDPNNIEIALPSRHEGKRIVDTVTTRVIVDNDHCYLCDPSNYDGIVNDS